MSMTITIELSDAAHAALLAHAKVQGKDAAAVAAEQLEELYAGCEPEAIEAIAAALAQPEEDDMSFEEYRAQFEAQRKARRQKREAANGKIAA
jgi:hypothetical protein